MLPVIAIVGRPNVGKSTLFNALTKTRDAIVAAVPGLTRDRKYGFGRVGDRPFLAVDTGGLSGETEGLDDLMARQTRQALDESDAVLFLVDAREGLTAQDEAIGEWLRRTGKPCHLVANKCEGLDTDISSAEFYALGMGEPSAISAAHGHNLADLIDIVLEPFPDAEPVEDDDAKDVERRVAVVGRPNVGKSTLINRLLGEERLLAYDQPGTTRDSVEVDFERDGRHYTLIDTAGVRRRSRVTDTVEKFSVIKTLQSIARANVVIAMLDAQAGITDQDATLLGTSIEKGRALVVAVNKWDGLSGADRTDIKRELERKLPFVSFARTVFISALRGGGIGELLQAVDASYAAARADIPTPQLTEALRAAVTQNPPPLVRGRRPTLRYAHQGGRNPPVIVVHGTQANRIPDHYQRYLINRFRKAFALEGTPVRLELRSGKNPFADRRNKLTPRQEAKRKRLKRHSRGKRK